MNPYQGRPSKYFWSRGVLKTSPEIPEFLYEPKFPIDKNTKIMTAGSCFAQHIGHSLKTLGFSVMDKESPNPYYFPKNLWASHGYGFYSCRYGNIYTAASLLQLAREAFSLWEPNDSELVWQNNSGRFFDSFRQSIDPGGFESSDEVKLLRKYHLLKVKEALIEADLLVFTLGLTEAWTSSSGVVYQSAPGVVAGRYNNKEFNFINYSFSDIKTQLMEFIDLISSFNPRLKILLTVSPVPLAATYSDIHVLNATVFSKSILRAVAGELYNSFDFIDYFPSYEIISNPWLRTGHYAENLRDVKMSSVSSVMDCFVKSHGFNSNIEAASLVKEEVLSSSYDIVCDEYLLDTFKGI